MTDPLSETDQTGAREQPIDSAYLLNWHRTFIGAAISIVPTVLYGVLLALGALFTSPAAVTCFMLANFKGAVGIPLAIIAALTIVVLLATGIGGDLNVEGLGFHLRGPSAPILLWVVCFLAIVLAIHVLFPASEQFESLPSAVRKLCV